MSTSPFPASGKTPSEADLDVLIDHAQDQLFDQEAEDVPVHVDSVLDGPDSPDAAGVPVVPVVHEGPLIGDVDPEADLDQSAYAEDSYEYAPADEAPRSTVYASLPGMPGRGVVLTTALATAGTAALDFALTGGLSYFFDLTFVVICLVAAMAVRGDDLFTTGVLPPIAFGATIALVALTSPTTFVAAGSGISQVFLTGLTSHAGALVFGYGVALATVAGRAAHHRHH